MEDAQQCAEPRQPLPAARASWVALGVVVFALALRLQGYTTFWINPDEGIYYSIASWPQWADFAEEVARNTHPPFYFLLIRGLIQVDPGFALLRLPALLGGCAAVHAAYILGRDPQRVFSLRRCWRRQRESSSKRS